jgi:hypothetical protein
VKQKFISAASIVIAPSGTLSMSSSSTSAFLLSPSASVQDHNLIVLNFLFFIKKICEKILAITLDINGMVSAVLN